MEILCFLCLTELCRHEKGPASDYRHEPTAAATPKAVTLVDGTALCGPCALDRASHAVRSLVPGDGTRKD